MRVREWGGLAIALLSVSRAPADDDPGACLTVRQANVQALPSDPPAVGVSTNDGRYVALPLTPARPYEQLRTSTSA